MLISFSRNDVGLAVNCVTSRLAIVVPLAGLMRTLPDEGNTRS